MNQEAKGRHIVPPTNEALRTRLALKLKEYEERIAGKGKPWEYWHPEQAHLLSEEYRDASYKADVLQAVLESNEPVDAWVLCRKLHEKWGDAFKVEDFCVACGVIDKYCGNLPNEPFLCGGVLPELPTQVSQ